MIRGEGLKLENLNLFNIIIYSALLIIGFISCGLLFLSSQLLNQLPTGEIRLATEVILSLILGLFSTFLFMFLILVSIGSEVKP